MCTSLDGSRHNWLGHGQIYNARLAETIDIFEKGKDILPTSHYRLPIDEEHIRWPENHENQRSAKISNLRGGRMTKFSNY